HRIDLLADPHLAHTFQNEERLFVHPVAMRRPAALARRNDDQTIAELLRADLARDVAELSFEFFRCRRRARLRRGSAVPKVAKLNLVDIDDGAVHAVSLFDCRSSFDRLRMTAILCVMVSLSNHEAPCISLPR